ncbi:MAG: YCF48-related protein [Dehalococcoidia bacterium]|nr:YCF48-related protein [Dehalococcoidia bacterium]
MKRQLHWLGTALALALATLLVPALGGAQQEGRWYVPLAQVSRNAPPPAVPPASGLWSVVPSPPPGIALFAVSSAGARDFWAVGSGGTVLHSADFGATWRQVDAGTRADLYGVRFLDETTGVIAGVGGTIRRTADGGRTWSTPAGGSGNLGFIWFASRSVGFIGGDGGTILKTTDGGVTWARQNSGFDRDITGIHCRSEAACWAAGSTDTGGVVLRTADGGRTWQRVGESAGFTPLGAVWFLRDRVGVVGGDPTFATGQSNIWRTDDGGAGWLRVQTDIFGPAVTGFAFVDEATGWASAEERIVLQTADGGATWRTVVEQLKTPGQNRWLHAIAALPSGHVVAVGAVYPADGSFTPLEAIIVRRH